MPTAKRSAPAKATAKQNDSEPPQTPAKAPRKPSRPRIDAIVNAIVRGDYDDKLKDLRDAIDTRNEARKAQVLALVQEVYGENVSITQPRDMRRRGTEVQLQAPRTNPFTDRAQKPEQDPSEEEIPSITSSSKSVQVVQGPDDEDLEIEGPTVHSSGDGVTDIISNSPQFS